MDKHVLKVYGPYVSKRDGRKRVVFYYLDKSTSVTSYARYLYEEANGVLPDEMTVDHIDENPTNDELINLQPLTLLENIQKARTNGKQATEWFEGICLECDATFIKPMRQIRGNQFVKGRPGPFCSKACSGKFNQRKQKEFRKSKPLVLTSRPINCPHIPTGRGS